MKKLLLFFFLLLIGSFTSVNAADLQHAYFRINNPQAKILIEKYLHHDFGDNIFSIEAPSSVINVLSKLPSLEFRGMASVWKISSHQKASATCSPSASLPWGVVKVNGGTATDSTAVVAVVDTGVYISHPDLKNNIAGCVDVQTRSLRKSCLDGNGHGTHVAGTIAANGKIKGVAPTAKILAIKVCSNSGWCWSDDVARGIRYAADNGAGIISISLGGSALALDEKNAIDYAISKGSLIVAAAGNSGSSDNTIEYPAAYAPVVAVGAIDSANTIASFSSRGNNYSTAPYSVEERDIEFVAPGVSIESTSNKGCYAIYSGTSMATPHVSGLAAVLWQGSAATTRSYLQDRARNFFSDLGRPGDDPDAGFGLPTAP